MRWIGKLNFLGDEYFTCSACGESIILDDGTPLENEYRYCPFCGDKSEGEDRAKEDAVWGQD